MLFIAVDDEAYMLDEIAEALHSVRPKDEILTFSSPITALEAIREQMVDAAFLDIQMGGMTGIDLAIQMKRLQPDIHIVFVTGYQEYAVQAYQIHATGYLLKPISEGDIARELTFIYGDEPKQKFRVQTFGGFELFVNEQPVKFDSLTKKGREQQRLKPMLRFSRMRMVPHLENHIFVILSAVLKPH